MDIHAEFMELYEGTDYIAHYGTKYHSGRYPYGSGEDPFQHDNANFRKLRAELKAQGLSDNDIAKGMGMSTHEYRARLYDYRADLTNQGLTPNQIAKELGMSSTEYRAMVTIMNAQKKEYDRSRILELKEKGYSNVKIAEMIDVSEGTVRNLLKEESERKNNLLMETANTLKDKLDANGGYIDIGAGSERYMGVSKEKLDAASAILEQEGYEVISVQVPQVTNKGKYTTVKVLAPPGTTYLEVKNNLDRIGSIEDFETGSMQTLLGIHPPENLSSDRIMIRYGDQGGKEMDGVIQLRRGVDDISLGNANYAQVRIAVDGKSYLKGMAVYSDDMPPGVDVIFNTNKATGTPQEEVFKDLKEDPDNPFGATITSQRGVINKVRDEGEWGEYSKTLSSQFLSKQPMPLIKKQLDLAYMEKLDEYETIMSLENETVKKKLLADFSEDCDAAAVHLKAAALPRQATQVILPVSSLSDHEIFAPNYNDGEDVVLIRYPHGGIFEIPRLKVNNKNKDAIEMIGKTAKDAVGINAKVAEQLSGADFDGDTVMVIPVNDKVKIRNSKPLEELKDFDPKERYPAYEGMEKISSEYKQKQMGVVSNLITDMTLQGAPPELIAKAVKHSMVVIDSEKHYLNWKQSEIDNDIDYLKRRYQHNDDGTYGGASTLISRAKSETRVDERKLFSIDRDTDPETGEKNYRHTGRYKSIKEIDPETGKAKWIKTGEKATDTSKKMAETNDARTLISKANTPQEIAYADYANKLKSLANESRKSYISISGIKRNPDAAKEYAEEVNSLKGKLNTALKNAPKERQAQIVANVTVKAKMDANAGIDKAQEKRLRQQALSSARARFGAKRGDVQVKITDREWEAIQAGAVSNNLLMDVLKNTDMDEVKQRAMPRDTTAVNPAKQARIKSLAASGSTNAEIAEALGISTSTVAKYL